MTQTPRRFHLIRREDETGVSGTGVIVEGVEFTDGTIALRWLTGTTSTAVYASIDDVRTIHGHGGKTVVMWLDTEMETAARATRTGYADVWTELTGWVQAAAEDGDRIDPAELLAYMRELRHRALAPMRDWMRRITGTDTPPATPDAP
jgi:hypothetical protein